MDSALKKIRRIEGQTSLDGIVEEAVQALARGGLILLPTETVYGLAGDLTLPGVLEKIYRAKGRPEQKPIPLLVGSWREAEAFGAQMGARARALAEKFWPGPLTMVLRTPEGFKGFRVPDDPVALAVLQRAGKALGVTSANRSGEPPAVTAAAAMEVLGDWVELALDAGPSRGGVPSTVVRVEEEQLEILRPGAIPASALGG